MTFVRRTLGSETVLSGDGLHSGEAVVVRLVPGTSGIQFVWKDARVEAIPENVRETNRCTRLGEISTVEHLMAAFAGSEVTDCDVVLTAPELPALDGSAVPYLQAIIAAGFQEFGEREAPAPFARVYVHEGDCRLAISAGEGSWKYEFSSPGRWPEFQVYETRDIHKDFQTEIAPARTFGFESEVPQIKAAGLAKGLDLEKALLIGESGYANPARFENEPARHKLLDAVGDLYLSGIPIRYLNAAAERTGHRMNVRAAQLLREAVFGSS